MTSTRPITPATSADLYSDIQRFYAFQMQLLDDGKVEEWSETFTDDGVFAVNSRPGSTIGRAAICAAARHTVEQLAADRIIRRHWLGMLVTEDRPDGTVSVRSYAPLLETPVGGSTRLLMSTVCEDVLVRVGEGWQVRERQVLRDGVA